MPIARPTLNAVNTNDALLAKQRPQFRDQFIANVMTNFSDEAMPSNSPPLHLCRRLPVGGVMTTRATETIAIAADRKARALPAVDAWIRQRNLVAAGIR